MLIGKKARGFAYFFKEAGISDLLSLIIAPVSDAAPFGANINHDPDFDALKAEFGKIGSLDLEMIEETAMRILKEKAKDLRVLAWLAYAMVRKDNWEGLADVFDGFAQLAAKNFDGLQPDRERAKELALKWLSEERFTGSLTEKKPAEADYPHISRLLEALNKIKPVLEQKFPQLSLFPGELNRNTVAWEKACKPRPVAPAAAGGAGASGGAEPMETPKQAQGIGRKAALFLIEKEPLRSMGYRLMRSIRWDILDKAPPAENGKTQLPGPNPQQRTYFQSVLGQQDWKNALEKAEAAFAAASNHLWLDLQRVIVTAAQNLGEQYGQVRSAVMLETAYFIKRLPDIISLQFSDGTAFCDEATKQWLSGDVAAQFSSASGGAGPARAAAAGDDPFAAEQQKVNQLVAANKIEEAIDLVQSGVRTAKCERESFRRTILVAQLLLKAKQPDIAVSMLEMLDQKIAAYSVDKWEPDLAVDAWSGLVQAYKVAKAGKAANILLTLSDRQNSILTKLSCIDPKKALLLNK